MAQVEICVELVALAVVLIIAVASYLASGRRTRELARLADAKGWSFSPDRDPEFHRRFPLLSCLSTGSNQYAHNRFEGRWRGRGFVGFDYHYSTGSGKSRRSHSFSGVILLSEVPLKPLSIVEERLIHRVGAFFGRDDINFESAEFSRAFRVQAADRRWAYDILHARSMELLLRSSRFSVEMAGLWLVAHRNHLLSPGEFQSALTLLTELVNALPVYVVEQQRQSGRRQP